MSSNPVSMAFPEPPPGTEQLRLGAPEVGVELASLEHLPTPAELGWGDVFRDLEGERQSPVDRLDDPGGHIRGGVPVPGADAAATLQVPAAGALMAHQFIDDPDRDAFVLQPGRKAVPIVGPAKLQMREVSSGPMG
jgi:hypothetical protein